MSVHKHGSQIEKYGAYYEKFATLQRPGEYGSPKVMGFRDFEKFLSVQVEDDGGLLRSLVPPGYIRAFWETALLVCGKDVRGKNATSSGGVGKMVEQVDGIRTEEYMDRSHFLYVVSGVFCPYAEYGRQSYSSTVRGSWAFWW